MADTNPDPETEPPSFYFSLAELLDSLILSPKYVTLIPNLPQLHSFTTLSPASKVLYIRLYLRKRAWIKAESLNYQEVAEISKSLEELLKCGFLTQIKDETENLSVSEILDALPAKKLKELCKSLHLKTVGSMSCMREAVLKKCRTQKSLFGGVAHTTQLVKNKCVGLLEDLVKVSVNPAYILDRLLIASFPQHILFSDQDDKITGQNNLSKIILSQFQITRKFPSYKISFSKEIFSSSFHLENFLSASELEAECLAHNEKHNWSDIVEIYSQNEAKFQNIVNSWKGNEKGSQNVYLLRFTEEWVLARVMRHCLTALQKLRNYERAVELLRLLLQYPPMEHRRGAWWENLALILDYHLKKKSEAEQAVRDGLADPAGKLENTIGLEIRLAKLDRNFKPTFTFEPKTISIEVETLEGSGAAANSKKIWKGEENGATLLTGVEHAALNHYINNYNFAEGFHCEGGIVSTLFGILCWDLIFSTVDNVFYNQYQYCPLDFWTVDFYKNRADQFNAHFKFLRELSAESLCEVIAEIWERNFGTGCDGLNWELFTDLEQCQRCVSCMLPTKLADLLELYVEDIRGRRSGIPDLSIWNKETGDFVMVEVKGPGDSLSNKQKAWLSRLDEIGIRAEVCLVKSISSKKIR